MTADNVSKEQWSSRWGFLLAAIGFSVGLGNIWRFPYVTGENGGSAFLIIYLVCAFVISLPLLVSELAIGRQGQGSSAGSYRNLATNIGRSPKWGLVGTLALSCVFIILSYYTVLSGWIFDYFLRAVTGQFEGVDVDQSNAMFSGLMNNPLRLLFWHTAVNLLIVVVVRRGVQRGIEQASRILMPALFGSLIIMLIYGAWTADIGAAMQFLLEPDFSKVTVKTVMIAIGQAFFSIGIGMAAMITFGSYLPDSISIPKSATTIILADTGVALLAGFVIFPIVFAFGMEPSSGAGLIFQTLPLGFGQMAGGQVFGSLFFLLLIAAALSSCIGSAEACVAWVAEHWMIPREKGVAYLAIAAWLVGFLTILSLGQWSEFYPLEIIPAFAEKTIFDSLDFLAANILLLVGGTLTALFFGWLMPKKISLAALGVNDGPFYAFVIFMIRFVIPPVLMISMILGLAE